ncbi:MAG TPA: hypothetical protein VIO81_16520 [Methyloversatilis sp.]
MKYLLPATAVLLAATLATAQEGSQDDRRRLVEQKIRLVEMLVNTQAAKNSAATAPHAPERLEKGRNALTLARQALEESRFDDAARILDDALRSSASAQRAQPPASLSEDALRRAHQNLIEQVATYRASVEEVATHPRIGSAARVLLTRIDAKSAEARKRAGTGELALANRLLGDAYQLAVSELSRLRSGEEVVHSLNFSSAAEEYAYEIRRFESNQLLVNMMVGDGKADGDRRGAIDNFQSEGRRLLGEADGQARAGQYKEAVHLMEAATGQLNRALQLMGVPVF